MSEKKTYPSFQADQFNVRFPDGLRAKIADLAKSNNRSMNAEIIFRLEASVMQDKYEKYKEAHGITPEEEKESLETLDRAWPAQESKPAEQKNKDELSLVISRLSKPQRIALLALLKSF